MSVNGLALDVHGYLRDFKACLEGIKANLAWWIPGTAEAVRDVEIKEIPFVEGIERTLTCIGNVKSSGASLIFVGNGGSAAIASHLVADFMKIGVRAYTPLDPSLLTCLSNDINYENAFAGAIKVMGKRGDVLFAISSSGQSANIINSVAVARERGMTAITLSGFNETNSLRKVGEINFYVPSSSYRFVEGAHLVLLSCIFDFFVTVSNYHTAPTWA